MCLVRIARSSANVKQSISMLDQPILIINLSNTNVKSNEDNPSSGCTPVLIVDGISLKNVISLIRFI